MASSVRVGQTAEASVRSFGPHVEELQEFFRSRSVKFGSTEDFEPFVERLESDAGFRDEMASMVRTIIYRERDALSRLELIELLAAAVGGTAVENDESPMVRDSVRRLVAFVEGVFRSRRNPGAAGVDAGPSAAVVEPETAAALVAAESLKGPIAEAAAVHPTTDVFYRAQVAAKGESAEERHNGEPIQMRPQVPESDAQDFPETEEHWHVPLEGFSPAEPERGPKVWLWVAAACALLLAFSGGLFVRQRILVPLRDPNQPYEAQPPEEPIADQAGASGIPLTPPPGSGSRPTEPDGKVSGVSASVAATAKTGPVSDVRASAGRLAGTTGARVEDINLKPRYMAPAVVGASPMVMAGRLVYAPPPAYPMMAQLTHTQGKVQVEAVVGKDGRVIRAQAVSGHHLLRGAAVREVYQRRYKPYTLNDRPTNVATVVTVYFRLK